MALSEDGLGPNAATEDFGNDQLRTSRMMAYGLVSSKLCDEHLPTKEATNMIRKAISDANRERNKQCFKSLKADCTPEDLRRKEDRERTERYVEDVKPLFIEDFFIFPQCFHDFRNPPHLQLRLSVVSPHGRLDTWDNSQ